jgi:hypothetical protein
MHDTLRSEIKAFRIISNFLFCSGLSEARAELWAAHAVKRWRKARRRGGDGEAFVSFAAAEKYLELERNGASPRDWL